MTVCVAGLINWTYDNGDIRKAIITASDRMLTVGEHEYEPGQRKIGQLSPRILALVSGSITVHAEAMGNTVSHLSASPTTDVGDVAEIYASYVRRYRLREAEQTYLAPLGLDAATFVAAQGTMAPGVVSDLVSQMQSHRIDAEAIVAGCDDLKAHLYHVDDRGFVTCHTDPGFVSIGIGCNHANAEIMAANFSSWWPLARSALLFYTAKKRAEVAPGVGSETDICLINRHGMIVLPEPTQQKIADIFQKGVERRKQGEDADEQELLAFFEKNKQPTIAHQPASEAISSSDHP